jgi:hypothetical protein
MASTIKIKNSSTAGAIPTSSDLVQGELAVNVTDKTIFTENASGQIVELGKNYTGFKNRIINGAMMIDQRNAGASVSIPATGAAIFTLDRFAAQSASDAVFSAQQDTTAPTGFINSLKFTTTTADASIAAGQYTRFWQKIEGFNVADLGWGGASAQAITLSFWVRSSVTGTFGGSLRNSAGNRNYPFSYSIASANTWEQKTITVAGDTSGTWGTSSGTGIEINWSLGTGTDLSGTAGAWTATAAVSATGATGIAGTLSATFYITGVQLEKGSTATSFDYRPYGTELALCQRYGVALVNGAGIVATGQAYSTSVAGAALRFPVTMRSSPTVTASSAANFSGADAGGSQAAFGGTNFGSITPNAFSFEFNARTGSGLVAGNACSIFANTSAATLFASAEL